MWWEGLKTSLLVHIGIEFHSGLDAENSIRV